MLAVMAIMCTSLVYEWLEWAIALALSPAMHLAYGSAPPGPGLVDAFRAAYGDPALLERYPMQCARVEDVLRKLAEG